MLNNHILSKKVRLFDITCIFTVLLSYYQLNNNLMEGFLILLVIIILIVIVVFPIIIYSKVSSIRNDIEYLNNSFNDLNSKLTRFFKEAGSQEAVKERQEATNELSAMENVEPISTEVKEPKAVEEVLLPDIHIAAFQEKILEDHPVEERTRVVDEPKEETIPSFAASISHENEETVVERIFQSSEPAFTNETIEPERNLVERFLGENWLSKVGIVTLVLGIAFFVKYAIDRDWINEIGRVGIGLLTGGIIIGIAHKLKRQYHVFSSILVGGGISVFYITITLAFREYELFSQPIAFVLLIAITTFSVILSLLYDRKELAIFSLLGGFASPLMISTGAGNYIVLFSYILILNTGMLVISFAKKWRVIGIMCYILTLGFFWSWLLTAYRDHSLVLVTLFAVLFFVQFYLLAIIDHLRTEKKVTAYQSLLILSNNLFVFLACLYVWDQYQYDVRGLITIVLAVFNAIVMFTLFRRSEVDRNLIYLIIAVVMTFVSLAIPIQLNGHVITMFWAAEAVVLLLLWRRSRINVFWFGFGIICLLTVISYVMDIHNNYSYDPELPILVNRIVITGIVVIVASAICLFILRKEDSDMEIEIRGFDLLSVGAVVNVFKYVLITLAYVMPFLELNYQLERFTDVEFYSSFRYLCMATYTALYIALLAFIYRRKASAAFTYVLLLASMICYGVFYSYMAIDLRFDIFYSGMYSTAHFLIHYLSLPAVIYIAYLLVRNIKSLPQGWFSSICWVLVVLCVLILSIETDHTIIALFGNVENYDFLLYDVHTFGYPILWGVLAMILMIWGLNGKEVLLRKISLIFFGVIILKFYAYDVWRMSQAGRIVSFIILGVILLSVSFLQQKIKTLVKADEVEEIEENKE